MQLLILALKAQAVLQFDVTDCWKFQDNDQDGSFGYGDVDFEDPTEWLMAFPNVSVYFE